MADTLNRWRPSHYAGVKLKNILSGKARNAAIGAAGSVVLGVLFLVTDLGTKLANLSYDLPFYFRPDVTLTNSEALVVFMDEDSRRALQQDPDNPAWDRALHARLLRALTNTGVRAVVFDVLFDRPTNNTAAAASRELADAITTLSNVVLAGSIELVNARGVIQGVTLRSAEEPIGSATPWSGAVELPRGPDGIVRRHFHDANFPSLALQTARLTGHAPLVQRPNVWFNHYGPPGTVPSVSYRQILDPVPLPPEKLRDKVLFIGSKPIINSQGTTRDEHPTPFTRWGDGETPGVELQATAFLNFVRRDYLTQPPPLAEVGIFILLGAFIGGALGRCRPLPALGLALGLLLALLVVAYLLHVLAHLWFAWLIVGAVQIPVALGWTVLAYTRQVTDEKDTLLRALATARSALHTPHILHEHDQPTTLGKSPAAPSHALSDTAPSVPPVSTADPTRIARPVIGEGVPPPIPNHTMLRCIGKGAYGEIWLARDQINHYHAVKIVYRASFANPDPYEREFRGIKEYTPISRQHPGLVHILHVGNNDPEGYFFYIMELGDDEAAGQRVNPATYTAKNLARELDRRGQLPARECLALALHLAAALAYLQKKKLLHRDIKPSNIIFVDGEPKLADVGLVTQMAEAGREVTYLGTPGYIPPEGPGTMSGDVFSLGKVIYEASMGRDRNQFPDLPSSIIERPDRDELMELNDIINRACESDPRRRYPNAAELLHDLAQLQNRIATAPNR